MSYVPSLQDVNSLPTGNVEYRPSLSDVNEASKTNALPLSLKDRIFSTIHSISPNLQVPLGMNVASGLMSTLFPKDQRESVANLPQVLTQQAPTGMQKFAQGIGTQMPLMMSGVGELPGVGGALARIGATGSLNAAQNPQAPGQSFAEGIKAGGIGEALPVALNTVGHLAEFINPQKYTNKLVDKIHNIYQSVKGDTSNIYEGLKTKFGDEPIYEIRGAIPKADFLNLSQDTLDEVLRNPSIKRLYYKFKENPNYENAQNLQSQMGSYTRNLSASDPVSGIAKTEVGLARKNLMNDMGHYLMNRDPISYVQYEKARSLTRDVLSPHDNSPLIGNIAEGNTKTIPAEGKPDWLGEGMENGTSGARVKPHELLSSLDEMVKSGSLPSNHYLRTLRDQLEHKINLSSGINQIASLGGGLGLGEMLSPGLSGALGGLGAGATAAKFVNPAIADIAQNPLFVEGLSKLKKPYGILRAGAVGEQLK